MLFLTVFAVSSASLSISLAVAPNDDVCGIHCKSDADCALKPSNCTWCLNHPNPKVGWTCSLQPTTCRGAPPSPANTSLPQYLILGDSVSHGYSINGGLVSTLLSDKLFEAVPVNAGGGGQCGDTDRGLLCLRAWIGTNATRFDLVSFNWGLHDLSSSTWTGPPNVPLVNYTRNLRNITRLLRRRLSSAKLLFITTTPVPDSRQLSPPRNESTVLEYNLAAKKVMSEEKIPVLDIWAWTDSICGGDPYIECPAGCAEKPGGEEENCMQRKNNVHFWPQGYKYIVKAIVAAAKKLQYGGDCPDFLQNITSGIC